MFSNSLTSILLVSLIRNVFCFNTKYEFLIDLTWDIDDNSIFWPGNRKFEFTKVVEGINSAGYWYSAKEFCMAEHGGTHLDAPSHFNPDGWTVGEIPLKRLCGFGATIDVSEEVKKQGSNFSLQVCHLEEWESKYGPFNDTTILLVRFGWSDYYHKENLYLGRDKKGNLNFPGISPEAAEWIVKTEKIVGVGIDSPSLDPGFSKTFLTHQILFKNQIFGLENLNIPKNIPVKSFSLFALPIKIIKGTGAPARVFAMPINI